MNSITQDMKCRQPLLTYAQKYGKSRSYSYFCGPAATVPGNP